MLLARHGDTQYRVNLLLLYCCTLTLLILLILGSTVQYSSRRSIRCLVFFGRYIFPSSAVMNRFNILKFMCMCMNIHGSQRG